MVEPLSKIEISVQSEDFDLASAYQKIVANDSENGAVVTFCGLVRDYNQGHNVVSLTLEHYPGMTERSLTEIAKKALSKWPLGRIHIIHRVGCLRLSEQIVFVGVSSKHREAAFAAAQYIMDYLKTSAPFWKKEQTETGSRWVEFNDKDEAALNRWQ